jgi:hypothetical protein
MAVIADCYRRMNQDLQTQMEQMDNTDDILSQKYTATFHFVSVCQSVREGERGVHTVS